MAIAKTVKLSAKGQIVVPQEIREEIGVQPGGKLVVLLRGKEVVLLSPDEYARQTCGMLKGAWGGTQEAVDAYLERERNSWE